ncbi:MAG: endo alpha-1,4 polygalactosaminidase [Planctomycetota bacterium]
MRSWAIQLQGLELPGADAALVAASVDMLVIEPTRTVRGMEAFATRALVRRITASPGESGGRKLCLAYVNVGQAEDYRTYWQPTWRAPSRDAAGAPDFLLALDPDGWPGNYPVAFWTPAWRRVAGELIEAAAADGFDGAYLDWVLGYQEPAVVEAARRQGVDPVAAMVDLLLELRGRARAVHAGFVLVAQNAAELVALDPRFSSAVDGVSQEDLSFRGEAGAGWDDAAAGDIATSEDDAALLADRLRACRQRGLCVFTLDYARLPQHVDVARHRARAVGAVPCVSRVALDRLDPQCASPAR